jgi:hypothetical protein
LIAKTKKPMKSLKSIWWLLFISTAVEFAARGQSFCTNINPALLYYQAFLVAPQPISDADMDYFLSKAGQEQKLPERFGKIVAAYDDEFKLLREAMHQKVPCDWGIDLSPGPATLLPHLARAKAAAQEAQLRAVWDLQHGNQAGARDDLLASFVLARNVSLDRTLIGALVQQANEAIVFSTVAANFGQFSPETLQKLENGFEAAPPAGTVAAAMATEKLLGPEWLANKVRTLQREYPGGDAKVMEAVHENEVVRGFDFYYGNKYTGNEGKGDTNIWQRIFVASGGTSDGLLKLTHEMEPLYTRLDSILTLPLPEFEDQIQKFNSQIRQSQNLLVSVLFPVSVEGARRREFRMQTQQAMVRAAVEYELHGESGFKSVRDPCGDGPFSFQRFVFERVDRGFELKSVVTWSPGVPFAMIFVENTGPPFYICQPHIGQPVQP